MLFRTLAIVFTFVGSVAYAAEPSEEAFFRGRTFTINIGYSPGGSYDFYGRALSRHIGKHIPGSPTVVVQSMPGAGSLRAANYMYSIGPHDGTTIAIGSQTMAIEEAVGNPAVKYKSAEFAWIGRVSKSIELSVTWHTSKVTKLKDALKHVVPVASTGPGSSSDSIPRVLNGVLGTKFKIVTGYPGSTDALLALERGEVEGGMPALNTLLISKPEWLKEKKINILVQNDTVRAKELPDVPTLVELANNEEEGKIFRFYASAGELGRAFFTSPNTPAKRVQTLRKAFADTMEDPDFREELSKAKAEFSPAGGAEIQKLVQDAASLSPAVIKRVKLALETQ